MKGNVKEDDQKIKLTAEQIVRFLDTLKDGDLSKHYTYKESMICTLDT